MDSHLFNVLELVPEYGYYKTAQAVQTLYDADSLSFEQAQEAMRILQSAYVAQYRHQAKPNNPAFVLA